MHHLFQLVMAGLLFVSGPLQSQTLATGSFDKVIVSPFIEATFIADDEERIVVNHSVVEPGKLHVENKRGTLRVYLDGAKELPKDPNRRKNSDDTDYPKRAVAVTIYYKALEEISLRGEEHFTFPKLLSADEFRIKLYGESTVDFAEVRINELHATIYGESKVQMQSGTVNRQVYTCYGEGIVNTLGITGSEAKLTAYGEAHFKMNVTDRIRISSFGEAKLRYKGNPEIHKPINVGGLDVAKLD